MVAFDLPKDDVRKALRAGAPAYLFVNPIEYHGPHLSLRNDFEISMGLAKDLHARLVIDNPKWGEWPMIAARELDIGVDPAPGPGSIATPYLEACERIANACDGLIELGADRVVIMTFHGSPLHSNAIAVGEERLRVKGVLAMNPLNLVLRELMVADGSRYAEAYAHVEDGDERAEMIRTIGTDFHAGFSETSVALHYAPHTVNAKYTQLPPCPPFAKVKASAFARAISTLAQVAGAEATSHELALVAEGLGWYGLRPFPGYTGRPHRATAHAGSIFARSMIDAYVDSARQVLFGHADAPAAVMRWLPALSLGGRIGAVHVPLDAVLRVA